MLVYACTVHSYLSRSLIIQIIKLSVFGSPTVGYRVSMVHCRSLGILYRLLLLLLCAKSNLMSYLDFTTRSFKGDE